MKMIAKARLSGPFGVKERGEEFTVDAKTGAELIDRRVAEEATATQPTKASKSTDEKA
ncbi:hypothetical protein G7009_01385 [Pseudomonas capeferrum]|uniref:hypothetical protein n=1 Tax=Pseudomonas capeferrum TaxID=1495066 RepID=UPI0015E39BA1|nr:hypothetical protein [Pseudomonas capeferrum]MBA1200455.1 hypothetical protein [Pseudomonas capeferrum]